MVTWPEPRPGLVVRYSYLWRREAASGREDGAEDRPCAVVVAVKDAAGCLRTYVLPITHRTPDRAEDGIEIPQSTKRRLGLDGERSWIILTEANVFEWPGPDLRFPPDRRAVEASYGYLPPALFKVVRERFLARARVGRADLVPRVDE